jgi:DNA processing protein
MSNQYTQGECFDADAANDELVAALRWLQVDGIGQGRLRQLVHALGGAGEALHATAEAIGEALGATPDGAARLLGCARSDAVGDAVERELAVLRAQGLRAVFEKDPNYPSLLAATHDPPAVVFVKGILSGEPEPAVAIVGSRSATSYGRLQAGKLAADLAAQGVTVVSGGARGIDAEAHRGALRAGGRTIAVLATGAAHPYPEEHRQLFELISGSGGCTISEQLPSVAVRPDLFPRRNRLIAALSLVTVVVEAASRSGALLTARIAVEDLSRDAGCMPGSVVSPLSEGCHRAIREGWAQLVTSADDVVELLEGARSVAAGAVELAVRRQSPPRLARRMQSTSAQRDTSARAFPSSSGTVSSFQPPVPPPPCSADASEVLAAIASSGRAGLDELEQGLGWIVPRIACATLELEVAGRIKRLPDGAFAVNSTRP